jgi:hypothetical protein
LSLTGTGIGAWGFTSAHRDVMFQSIGRFNHVELTATAVAASTSSVPTITVRDAETGAVRFTVTVYENYFRGGVQVAFGDINHDGIPDLIVAPGVGREPLVKVYSGAPDANGHYAGQLLTSFDALTATATQYGINLAVGDVNGDGADDIVTAPRGGWLPQVRVFNGPSLMKTTLRNGMPFDATPVLIGGPFNAFEQTFTGGVRLAVADLNNDGYADIIAGKGAGDYPTVNVFSGRLMAKVSATGVEPAGFLVNSFSANAVQIHGGVFLAAGDINGDGVRDIIVGSGPGSLPYVFVYSGANIFSGAKPPLLVQPMALPNYARNGVPVCATPLGGGNPGFVEAVAVNGMYTGQGVWTGVETPTLNGPAGAIVTTTPDLFWTAVPGATSYQVQLVDLTTKTTYTWTSAGVDLRVPFALTRGRSYRWQVRAVNATGVLSPWSNPLMFSVS